MLKELLDICESRSIAEMLDAASGIHLFVANMDNMDSVITLKEACKKERAVALYLLGHMLDLATRSFDTSSANPFQQAVTIYLHVIVSSFPDLEKSAIKAASLITHSYWPPYYIKSFLNL